MPKQKRDPRAKARSGVPRPELLPLAQLLRSGLEQSGKTQRLVAAELQWARSKVNKLITGQQPPAYLDVLPLARALKMEDQINSIFALANMPPTAGPAHVPSDQTLGLLKEIQASVQHWRTSDSQKLDETLTTVVVQGLRRAAPLSLRSLADVDQLLVLTRSRVSETATYLTGLLLLIRMTIEIKALWPDYDPGAENPDGRWGVYMFFGADQREFEHTRRNAPAVVAIADRYLTEYDKLPHESSTASGFLVHCAGVLMNGYLAIHGMSESGLVATTRDVDRHLQRVGAHARPSDDDTDNDETISMPRIARQMRILWD